MVLSRVVVSGTAETVLLAQLGILVATQRDRKKAVSTSW